MHKLSLPLNMLSYLKLCDKCTSVTVAGGTAASLTDAVPSPFVSL